MNPYLPRPTITADVEADLARFNAGVDRAKRAYYGGTKADGYKRRTDASAKQMRYQRRKKEQQR